MKEIEDRPEPARMRGGRAATSGAERSAAWLPIKTAPKDGTWVGGWIVFAGNDYSPDPFERFTVMYWREENRTPGFEREAGWEATWIGEPTHWMPLPGAPQ